MDSKNLPTRENIESLSQIVLDLEKIRLNQPENSMNKKNFKKNVNKGPQNPKAFDNNDKNAEHKILLQAKNQQIDKLVDKLSVLYNYNSQYAIDNEALKRENVLLRSKVDEVQKRQQESFQIYEKERENTHKENEELKNDLKMMKILVYRLNVQLESHQALLHDGGKEKKHQSETQSNDFSTIDWGDVNSHTLAPLLQAYHEYINEKVDLIQQYENELNIFTKDFKEIMKENEMLHEDLTGLKNSYASWSTEKTRMQTQLDVYHAKAETQTKRADLAKEKLIEVLKCYEKKTNFQQLELERLQEAYQRTKQELANLRSINKEPEVVVESLRECQRLFEELKVQHDTEKKKMEKELDELKASSKTNENKSSTMKEENSEMKHLIQKLQEINKSLLEKNVKLRQKLHRARHTHELLNKRLKNINNNVQQQRDNERHGQQQQSSVNQYQDLKIRNMQMNYLAEIEGLSRKLKQREETLKLVLQEKAKPKSRRK